MKVPCLWSCEPKEGLKTLQDLWLGLCLGFSWERSYLWSPTRVKGSIVGPSCSLACHLRGGTVNTNIPPPVALRFKQPSVFLPQLWCGYRACLCLPLPECFLPEWDTGMSYKHRLEMCRIKHRSSADLLQRSAWWQKVRRTCTGGCSTDPRQGLALQDLLWYTHVLPVATRLSVM